MESRKQAEDGSQKGRRRFASFELSSSEYVFVFLATVIETVMPVMFFFFPYRFTLIEQVMVILVSMLVIFGVYMDISTFFQKNHINYLYFQFVIYVMILLFGNVLIWLRKEAISTSINLGVDAFQSSAVAIMCGFLYAVLSFLILVVFDVFFVLVLVAYGKLAKIDMHNSYIERLNAARTMRGFEEYTRKMFWENQNRAYVQMPLFEQTRHFKNITSLDQVKPRYHMLMKRYHPDNAKTDTVRICQEIQDEYQEIVRRYNL